MQGSGSKGMAFVPLLARSGTTVVPTVSRAGLRSRPRLPSNPSDFHRQQAACLSLPPAATPGVVDVTLSKHPQPNAPEYGTSIAKFYYLGYHDLLYVSRMHPRSHTHLEEAFRCSCVFKDGIFSSVRGDVGWSQRTLVKSGSTGKESWRSRSATGRSN